MPVSIKLIVGLGNPGPEYLLTRHNAGFWFLDALSAASSLTFNHQGKFKADVARMQCNNTEVMLCKPQTFMNCSGQSVQAITHFYKIPVEEILIVHDEIDLDAGTIRLKQGGGHGGNNGLRDIIGMLGSNDFKRIRIGIGHPGNSNEVINYVLGKPSREDSDLIMEGIGEAIKLIPEIVAGDFQNVMTTLHSRQNLSKPDN